MALKPDLDLKGLSADRVLRLEAAASAMQPRIREDLPQPETPVSTVRRPSGMLTSIPLRLLAEHPVRRSQPVFAAAFGNDLRG